MTLKLSANFLFVRYAMIEINGEIVEFWMTQLPWWSFEDALKRGRILLQRIL